MKILHLTKAENSLITLYLIVLYCAIISFVCSVCNTNSFAKVTGMCLVFFIVGIISFVQMHTKQIRQIEYVFCIIIIVFSIGCIPYYYYYVNTVYSLGMSDLSQFRYLYTPLCILSNDWVSLLLLLIPYPLIGLFRINAEEKKSRKYVLYMSSVSLALIGILLTMSRAGWFCVLCVTIYILHLALKMEHRHAKTYIIAIVACVCLTFAGLCVITLDGVASTIMQSESHVASSVGRINQFSILSNMSLPELLFGIGPDNFPIYNLTHKKLSIFESFTGRANCAILKVVTEFGICGLFLFVMLLVNIVRRLSVFIVTEQKQTCARILTLFFFVVLLKELFFASVMHYSLYMFLFLLPFVIYLQDANSGKFSKRNIWALLGICVCGVSTLSGFCINDRVFTDTLRIGYNNANTLKFEFRNMTVKQHAGNAETAISSYLYAISQTPLDASFFNNLAWLKYSQANYEEARCYMEKAISLDKNNPLYYIGKGLFWEKECLDSATVQYSVALSLNPTICFSQFWMDFSLRHPRNSQHTISQSMDILRLKGGGNAKSQAKLGIFYYWMGDKEKAKYHLLTAINRLPNLNRAWMYLSFCESDKILKMRYLDRSIFLNRSDNLSKYIKYHDKRYLEGNTDYLKKTTTIYNHALSWCDCIPRDFYTYVNLPVGLFDDK